MMSEQERVELEAENDGFRNEYQRAAAWSAMQPKNDERWLAEKYVSEGYHVSVRLTPRHCKITDAAIGEDVWVIFYDRCRDIVMEKGIPAEVTSDERIQIWPMLLQPNEPMPVVADDDVPF